MEFEVLLGDSVRGGRDLGGELLLGNFTLGDRRLEYGDGGPEFGVGSLEGLERGDFGGDFDGPGVDHHFE